MKIFTDLIIPSFFLHLPVTFETHSQMCLFQGSERIQCSLPPIFFGGPGMLSSTSWDPWDLLTTTSFSLTAVCILRTLDWFLRETQCRYPTAGKVLVKYFALLWHGWTQTLSEKLCAVMNPVAKQEDCTTLQQCIVPAGFGRKKSIQFLGIGERQKQGSHWVNKKAAINSIVRHCRHRIDMSLRAMSSHY